MTAVARSRNYARGDFGHHRALKVTAEQWQGVALWSLLPVVLAMWGATQWFAHTFDYAPALGSTLFLGGHLYPPWAVIGWWWELSGAGVAELQTVKAILFGGVAAGALSGLLAVGRAARQNRNRADELHDSGRWGTEEDLRRRGELQDERPKDGIILGRYRADPYAPESTADRDKWVSDNTDTCVFCMAPPGSGKNVGIITPTLLTWQHSCVCIDPKLENHLTSAGYRSKHLHQYVGVLDFLRFDIKTEDGREFEGLRYNPLDAIRLGTDLENQDALSLAICLTDTSGKGVGDPRMEHWVVTPAGIIAAGILHVMYRAQRENWGRPATLYDVQWELSGRKHPAVEEAGKALAEQLPEAERPEDPTTLVDDALVVDIVLASWMRYDHAPEGGGWPEPDGTKSRTNLFVAMRAQEQLARKGPEGASHMGSVRKALTLFEDAQTRKVTACSDFKISDLQATKFEGPDGKTYEGLTLFMPVKVVGGERVRPLYRAFFVQALGRLTEDMKPAHLRKRLLLLLDEGHLLGPIQELLSIFSVGRGYGIRVKYICQTAAQLDQGLGRDSAAVLMDNCPTVLAMAPTPSALRTVEMLSKMTGKANIQVNNKSTSMRGGTASGAGRNESQREFARPQLTPGEILQLPDMQVQVDEKGAVVEHEDGTKALRQRAMVLMFKKNVPPMKLLLATCFADPEWTRLSKIPPPKTSARRPNSDEQAVPAVKSKSPSGAASSPPPDSAGTAPKQGRGASNNPQPTLKAPPTDSGKEAQAEGGDATGSQTPSGSAPAEAPQLAPLILQTLEEQGLEGGVTGPTPVDDKWDWTIETDAHEAQEFEGVRAGLSALLSTRVELLHTPIRLRVGPNARPPKDARAALQTMEASITDFDGMNS